MALHHGSCNDTSSLGVAVPARPCPHLDASVRPLARPRAEASREARWWSRLGSNQRPSACEADALPLSYRTGAERRTRSKISTLRRFPRTRCSGRRRGTPGCIKKFVRPAWVDYRRPSRRATISSVARGCSAVGSASPCQGEGRGFESRHPLGRCKWHQPQRWSGRVVRQRPAKPCTRVRFPSPPPFLFDPGAVSSAGERFPDTEEVAGSIPVPRTNIYAGKGRFP